MKVIGKYYDNSEISHNLIIQKRVFSFLNTASELKWMDICEKELRYKALVKVRSFSLAKLRCTSDHAKTKIWNFNPQHITLHLGINTLKNLARSIIDFVTTKTSDQNIITVSLILLRKCKLNKKANEVNN